MFIFGSIMLAVSKISVDGFMAHLWVSEVVCVYYTAKYSRFLDVNSDGRGIIEKHSHRITSF